MTYNFGCMNKRSEEFHVFLIHSTKKKYIYIHIVSLQGSLKLSMGPCCKFFKEGGGAMFLAVGFKGEATLRPSMKEFLICMCQISPKVAKSSL